MDQNSNQVSSEHLRAVLRWVQAFPSHAVELRRLPLPDDSDDYDLIELLEVVPRNPLCCPIELGFSAYKDMIYMQLDKWGSIAHRCGLIVPPEKEVLIGLYFEPKSLSVDELMGLCQQIAAGAVELQIGILGKSLVGTRGSIQFPQGRFVMQGVSDWPFWVIRFMERLGWARTLRLPYAPWV